MKNILLIILLIFVFLASHFIYYNYSVIENFKEKCYSKCKYKFDKCDNKKEKCINVYNECYKNCGFYPKEAIYTDDYRGNILVNNKYYVNPCCQ